MIHSTRV